MEKQQRILEDFKEEKNVAINIFEEFLKTFSEIDKTENRIRFCLDFMHLCLQKDEIPSFRYFWETKQLCLELFKENISAHNRSIFWQEYLDLVKQARTLKQILDEKSSFSEEQIRLAILALEKDFNTFKEQINNAERKFFPENSLALKAHREIYITLQQEIDLLNIISKRIKSLRDDLIEIKMRVRVKNQFFADLAEFGDRIFPRRKELIETISKCFQEDVENFTSKCDLEESSCFSIKEEIKILQNIAKEISINSYIFSLTREMLSNLWNQIQHKQQEHKLQSAEKREISRKNMQEILLEMQDFMKTAENKTISVQEIEDRVEVFFEKMDSLELEKEESKFLKNRLFEYKKSLLLQIRQKKEKKQEEEKKENQIRKQHLVVLQEDIQSHIDRAKELSLDVLVEKWDFFLKQVQGLVKENIEQDFFHNLLAILKDFIQEKKWMFLLEEKPSDLQSKMQQFLEERIEERKKLKMILEAHRKIIGGSSLNLEMAMNYQRLIEEEKIRFESLEMFIEEVKQKLFDFE